MLDEVLHSAAVASYGLRRAPMACLGAAAVFAIQFVAVRGGLGLLLTRWPLLQVALQYGGAACLPYLGWQLLRQRGAGPGTAGEPLTFWEAAALQFLNPKAWLMSLAAATLLLPLQLEQVMADGYSGRI
jgi:threonine/homoserine/homoserine lactone efflux protein